ncbi:conjugal transfer protein TraC [Vibrio tasmaniensis]|nr:conjugal transfer protein TraC [Vibrio tasmaniensis]
MGLFEKRLIGNNEVTRSDIEALQKRDRFSSYLPYRFYNENRTDEHSGEKFKTDEFVNADATIGRIWECQPLTYVGNKQLNALHGLLKQSLPFGSIIQFILMTDHDLTDVINNYKSGKDHSDPVARKSMDETEKWLKHCAKNGNPKMSGIPVRRFRCFVALKTPKKLEFSALEGFEQSLKSSGLAPRTMNDQHVRALLFKIFNNERITNPELNPNKDIRRQIIKSDTVIEMKPKDNFGKIGSRYMACLTPQDVPEGNNPLQTNALFGGYMGKGDDTNQITVPFLYSLNIIVEDRKSEIDGKHKIIQWQRVGSAMMHKLDAVIKDLDRAKADIEKNKGKYYRFIPNMVVFGETKHELEKGVADVVKIWTESGFEMQRETKLKTPLFISSLPFGLYNVEKNVDNFDRHFIANREDIARFLPVQGDFCGSDQATSVWMGRKGSVIGMNHFDKRVDSYNFGVFGQSGGGKTFLLNDIMEGYVSSGYKIRVIDIGGGFEKLTQMKGGKYFDFTIGNCPCINPLDFHVFSPEEIALKPDEKLTEENIKNIAMAEVVVGLMAFSKSGKRLDETEAQLISEAVNHAVYTGVGIQGPTAVQSYLRSYKDYGDMKGSRSHCRVAEAMAYNMSAFCAGGAYESIFCGKNTFDIKNEKVVAVELEHIRQITDLFQVVTLQMMNLITQDLYLGDRSTQTVILVEEVISFLKENGQGDTARYSDMIEEGYRRARKYRGSFGCVFQSTLDLNQLGQLGEVINSQAIFKYYLESSAFDKAAKLDLIPVASGGGFGLDLLNSVSSQRPKYSEFFIDAGPLGRGVARLCVDSWRYWCNTSDGEEFARYKACIKQGMKPEQALSHLSGVPL